MQKHDHRESVVPWGLRKLSKTRRRAALAATHWQEAPASPRKTAGYLHKLYGQFTRIVGYFRNLFRRSIAVEYICRHDSTVYRCGRFFKRPVNPDTQHLGESPLRTARPYKSTIA